MTAARRCCATPTATATGYWRSRWAYVGSVPEGEPPRRSWGLSVDADEDPEVCVEVMAVNLVNWLAVPELRSLEGNPTQETCVEPFGPAEGAPAAPESLSVTSVEADRAELEWGAPDGSGNSPLWGYRVEVSTDGGGSWSVVEENTGTPARRWSDEGVANLAERLYRVRAVNTAYGAGNPSPAARLAAMALKRLDTSRSSTSRTRATRGRRAIRSRRWWSSPTRRRGARCTCGCSTRTAGRRRPPAARRWRRGRWRPRARAWRRPSRTFPRRRSSR